MDLLPASAPAPTPASTASTPHASPSETGRAVVLAGLVSLAVAMGIGRFAFTPLMPMMLAEHQLDLPAAGWLASINYLGYLAGALACMLQPWAWRRLGWHGPVDSPKIVRTGLAATVLLTLAMALHWPAAWPGLRFVAGVTSAVVFVHTSGWVLARLAQLNAGRLGGVMYAGPGAGIVVGGLSAGGMVAAGWSASLGWSLFGLLALVLTALVWRTFRAPVDSGAQAVTPQPSPAASPAAAALVTPQGAAEASPQTGQPHVSVHPSRHPHRTELILLAAAYGLAGFGYIVTATFLPVIARQALPGSAWIDLFWPILGAGVMVGALLASRLPEVGDRRLRLAGGYTLQAAGILISLAWPSLPGFLLGSVLVGLPFTAITLFAMQDVRRLRPDSAASAASAMGFVTMVYGTGQILGPVLVAVLLRHSATPDQGFGWALCIAAGSLMAGVAIYLWMVRAHPLKRPAP